MGCLQHPKTPGAPSSATAAVALQHLLTWGSSPIRTSDSRQPAKPPSAASSAANSAGGGAGGRRPDGGAGLSGAPTQGSQREACGTPTLSLAAVL
jgi:hypothetical protein